MRPTHTRSDLERLLQRRNEYPDQAEQIDAEIFATFAETHAVWVLDMSGFSRLSLRYSIIHFLAMVHQLRAIAVPIIQQQQGHLVKQDADNLFAIFPTVDLAVDAAIATLNTLAAVNTALPDARDLYASIGIGYGEMLMLEDGDLYGNELNLAAKLGEDLARAGEILVTETAFRQLSNAQRQWEKLELSISGLSLLSYKLLSQR